jgi:anti-sigma factor (TIGR02949 family)
MENREQNSGCEDFKKCMEILQLMLDNEASKDQEHFVNDHIDNCMVCFEQYQVEQEIRKLLKSKIANQPVPNGLVDDIRTKIQSISS